MHRCYSTWIFFRNFFSISFYVSGISMSKKTKTKTKSDYFTEYMNRFDLIRLKIWFAKHCSPTIQNVASKSETKRNETKSETKRNEKNKLNKHNNAQQIKMRWTNIQWINFFFSTVDVIVCLSVWLVGWLVGTQWLIKPVEKNAYISS